MAQLKDLPHPPDHKTIKVVTIEGREQYAQSISRAVKIYRDGSKIGDKVGAALTI